MNVEHQLINKAYFEKYMEESTSSPVQTLGELYLEENKNDIADFSYIRFAQGEVYFHHKDFEAAIFKWENIQNELAPWAKKNMADAYIELGLLETAEGIYQSIETDSPTLRIETNLQLLTIYIEQGKREKAKKVINEAVALNPDYPEITEIARQLFEEHEDWDEAVRLATGEAVRTGVNQWYTTLKTYIDEGYTAEKEPAYFNDVLASLFSIEHQRFESLVGSLWNSYKGRTNFYDWLINFNRLFRGMETSRHDLWKELPRLYEESYFDLINGSHLIKEISAMIPEHLMNWLKVAKSSTSLVASSSVMAWNEMFPTTLPAEVVRHAEELILTGQHYDTAKEDSLQLFDAVRKWAVDNGMDPGNMMKWHVEELANDRNQHLLLVGLLDSGKADFINQFLGETWLKESTSSVVTFKYDTETVIHEITDTDVTEIENYEQFQEAIGTSRKNHNHEMIVDVKLPNNLLKEMEVTIIDTPSILHKNVEKNLVNQYVHLADSLLFFLNMNQPLTEKEKEILKQVSIQAPNLPVHFILINKESLLNDQEMNEGYEKTKTRVRTYYPNAQLLTFQLTDNHHQQRKHFSDFITSAFDKDKHRERKIVKLQHFVGRSIHYLLDKRIEMENNLVETMRWNEEMVSKLNGAINQVQDLEEEKKKSIKNAYEDQKNEVKQEMLEEIPKLLRGTSELIKEDSDFGKLHLKLNEEMNQRVQNYLEQSVLKKLYSSLQCWIENSQDEFNQAQFTLDEMSAGFNTMYGEERIKQECDFKVLEDWRRDADRMTNGISLEEYNFLLRFTPAQFFLKSAGKLLAVLPKNNALLYNKYKSYLENEDYHDSAKMITEKFFKQFELFEKSIVRDINLFFRNPLHILRDAVKEAEQQIQVSKEELEVMRIKPERYRDPLNLFEVKLRQYEWMAAAGRNE
ncbi:dynamin family protein [Bacillus sp. B15-48]|uniref:dynamin family protein n=1 Tax=Bacillus sp. B15-48 TaxID=1548601 RepID=UPI00193FAAAB|nr:dynamin family protein [Bacillus sp. B15-48]MBM4765056.1 GTP-binding protein [Bacillus sp. B15-48]